MTKIPKFSILTPVHLWSQKRIEDFGRCVESVRNQTFKDFEWIVVNDGSTLPFSWETIKDIARVFEQPHLERIVAYNKALENANGKWFCFLDSDDEYDSRYLERVNKMIKKNSNYKMFNFGCKFVHKDGKTVTRDPFRPKKLRVGHEMFGGGNVVNGTFVFHKDVYKDLGAFPPQDIKNIDCSEINYGGVRDLCMCSPWDFSAYYQLKYPEIRKYFMIDHVAEPQKILKEMGNPWGNDFILWYQYTRKYHSKPFKEYLYIVHLR